MTKYVKFISDTKIEYAPINKDGIINYNLDVDRMKQDGYKEFVKIERPDTDRFYEVKYTNGEKISEQIVYLETEEECQIRKTNTEICEQIAILVTELNELDLKRIRAVCEPSVKVEETGETWLEFYNSQIFEKREGLQELQERIISTNDISE